jgi:hypothetical protein
MARLYPITFLYAIGVLLSAIGLIAAVYAPVEFYSFYLFSESGRFYYEGFGFGSLMFAIIAWQIILYYLIAAIFIPLGYAHLRLRHWVRTVSVTMLWCWLVLGIPLLVFGLTLFSFMEIPQTLAVIFVIILGSAYLIIPWLLIRFYQSEKVIHVVESRDPNTYRIEKIPIPVLVLSTLSIFYIFALHLPIFFNGIFPFFGNWFTGLEGIILIEIFILCLVLLFWGVIRSKKWAWWGLLFYFGLLAFTVTMTLLKTSYPELLSLMNFPPTEMEILQGMPLQGYHLAIIFGLPLLLSIGVTLFSNRHFKPGERGTQELSQAQ